MAETESGQEKTEQPTPKKLMEAREKGTVARSRELGNLLTVFAGALILVWLGPNLVEDIFSISKKVFSISRPKLFDSVFTVNTFFYVIKQGVLMLVPTFLIMLVAAVSASLALGGWVFSMQALQFKFERLDPVKGLKRVFGYQGLIELAKAMAKFFLLVLVAIISLNFFYHDIFTLGLEDVFQSVRHAALLLLWSLLALCSALLIVALIDVPFQIWNHTRNLKMSRQEVKDELKQTEGDPEMQGKIKAIQREMSKRRMLEDVKDADVVLVNPSHYSVALKYENERNHAPKVVAKGGDMLALKIREIASHHNVYIYSEPVLTRAIYYSTKIGQEIPRALYFAVAQVLAYVYHVNRSKKHGGVEPEKPKNLPIPEDYIYDAQGKSVQ